MTWNHPALAQRALDEGDQEIKRLRARIEQLEAALKVARQWMPIHPIPNTGAVEDCALVDAALANSSIPTPEKP